MIKKPVSPREKAGRQMSGIQKKSPDLLPNQVINTVFSAFPGGDKRDRTADLLNAIQALSQLSYTPVKGKVAENSEIIKLKNQGVRYCFAWAPS